MRKVLSVYCTADDNYVLPSIIALESVRRFHPECDYFVLGNRNLIRQENLEILQKFDIKFLHSNKNELFPSDSWPNTTYLNLFGPEILLREGYEYSLGLDADTLCVRPLEMKAIFEKTEGYSGIENHAPRSGNFVEPKFIKERFALTDADMYSHNTNTGVVFWNNKAAVEKKLSQRAVEAYRICAGKKAKIMAGDQALLALISVTEPRIPFNTINYRYNYRVGNKKDLNLSPDGVRIFHYTDPKPWDCCRSRLNKDSFTKTKVIHLCKYWQQFVVQHKSFRKDDTLLKWLSTCDKGDTAFTQIDNTDSVQSIAKGSFLPGPLGEATGDFEKRYSNLIDLKDFFKYVNDYVILKLPESFPNYFDHSDIDILCRNRDDFLAHILRVGEEYERQEFQIKVDHKKDGHLHVDFYPPKAQRLNFRFDLIDSLSYENLLINPQYCDVILDSRQRISRDGVDIYVPSLENDLAIRLLEYLEYKDKRPEKIKHLEYIKKFNNFDFVGVVNQYTNLNAIVEMVDGKTNLNISKKDLTADSSTIVPKVFPAGANIQRGRRRGETLFEQGAGQVSFKTKCWILSYPRSGSVYLCYLMHSTNLFPSLSGSENGYFKEHFNELRLKEYYSKQAYKTWMQADTSVRRQIFFQRFINKGGLPPIAKVMREQFLTFCGLDDGDKALLEYICPGLKYIHLKRDDIFARVISLYFAKQTNRWVLAHKNKEEYLKKKIPFKEKEITDLYQREYCFSCVNDWSHYLKDSEHLYIDFDNFVSDPLLQLKKALDYLGLDYAKIDLNSVVESYPYLITKRPETDEYIDKLKKIVLGNGKDFAGQCLYEKNQKSHPKGKRRVDYFLIWGNGLQYTREILDIIRSHKDLEIIYITKKSINDIGKFVQDIYACDTVPFKHLIAKTRYLLNTRPEIIFMLVKNNNAQEKLFGQGQFRHIQCQLIKDVKEEIRNKFNPRVNGKRTEEHVIHASDYESQVEHVLKVLGLPSIEFYTRRPNPDLDVPYHIAPFDDYLIKEVDIDALYANILGVGVVPMIETPHYKYLTGDRSTYQIYYEKYFGKQLTEDHSPDAYDLMLANFKYDFTTKNGRRSLILAKILDNNKYQILDGVHRAAILRYQGVKTVAIAEPVQKIKGQPKQQNSKKYGLIGLIFSKDRAMQLQATIESFKLHCTDSIYADLTVLYKASNPLHRHQYDSLKTEFADVNFVEEVNFREQVLSIIEKYNYVLFLVDDNIFVRDFCLADIVRSLDHNTAAICFSLRLGENSTYCYMKDIFQNLPNFNEAGRGVLGYNWVTADYDFGYPLELSSSLYRLSDLLPVLKQLRFSNPNTLESMLDENKWHYQSERNQLLCYKHSVTFCNPVNIVQTAWDNRSGKEEIYSSENLAFMFKDGYRIDVAAYTDFLSNGCHQEVSIKLHVPIKVVDGNPQKQPLVSVVVPCYNQACFLSEAIGSVVAQTYANWECIIVNDGSPDNTTQIAEALIKKYPDKRIRLINQVNQGLATARNEGIKVSNGVYILPLDADDLIHPRMLEKTVALLESRPEIAIAYTDLIHFGARDRIVRASEYDFNVLIHRNHLSYCSLYRREAWEFTGGYNSNMVEGMEDWDFWIGCGEKGYYAKRIPELLFIYRVKANSMYTQAVRHRKKLEAQIILNHPSLYDKHTVEAAKSLLSKITVVQKPLDQNILVSVSQRQDEHHNVGDTPMISVIVPTHNRPDSLKKTLDSVLSQTLQDFEIIVINDGGTDVKYIVDELNSKGNVIYLKHDTNKGSPAAKNTGLRNARGKYITYLDDDDIYYPDHLERLVTFLESTDYKVAYTDSYCVHLKKENEAYIATGKTVPYSFDVNHEQLLVRNLIPILCIMHEKSCLDEVGYFDETLTTHEDWDLWIRMSRIFDFYHIKEITAEVTMKADGTTTTSSTESYLPRRIEVIYKKYENYVVNKPHVIEQQKRRIENLKQRYYGISTHPVQSKTLPVSEKLAERRKLNVAIKICTRTRGHLGWGDTNFANSLAKSLKKSGHNCEIHFHNEWDRPDRNIDVVIHLKGLFSYVPKPYNFNILWIISHPELHTIEEINQYDVVFCASKLYLEKIKEAVKIPCFYLPQATDRDVFKPPEKDPTKDIDILFVGNNHYYNDKNVKCRNIIQDVLDTGKEYNLCVVGKGWRGNLDERYIKADLVDWQALPQIYTRAKIVLNDHHKAMKEFGFINNRTFDVAALKVFQISDYVEGMEEFEIVTYKTPAELREKLDYFLQNEEQRKRIANINHELCKNFSFDNAIQNILDVVKRLFERKNTIKIKDDAILHAEVKPVDIVPSVSTSQSSPKVSIIVSCYNSEKFLSECIDSIRNQTMQQWELLLLNDASTDGTKNVIEKYAQMDKRIKPYHFETNGGPYIRRNFGIERSCSDFIVIHDADDIMCPNKLEVLYYEITKDPQLAIVGSFYRKFLNKFTKLEYTEPQEFPTEHKEIVEGILSAQPAICHASSIIRKGLFEAIGLYDKNRCGCDSFWLTKVAIYTHCDNNIKLKNIPEFLMLRRIHSCSQTGAIPTFDPRSRRFTYGEYFRNKLNEITSKIGSIPYADVKAELKNCECSDFAEKYSHIIEQAENKPLDTNAIVSLANSAAYLFNTCRYVTCISGLHSLEKMGQKIAKRFKNYDLLKAMAYFALDMKEQCLEYLNREIQNHNNPAARQFVLDYFENNSKDDVKSWCTQNDKIYDLRIIYLGNETNATQVSVASTNRNTHIVQSEQKQSSQNHPCKQLPPLVSIIMPAYNAQYYIKEAVDSVFSQSYEDFELIIVDDGSTDNTEDIIVDYKNDKIKYFRKENEGVSSARNMGIKNSKGDFIINLDSDDLIAPDFITKHMQEFRKHPEADLIYCDDQLINSEGKLIRVIERPEYTNQKFLIRDLLRYGYSIVPFRGCMRRRVYETIGLYDEGLLVAEDYDMVRRFIKSGMKMHHLNEALYLRRLCTENLSKDYSVQNAECHFNVVKRFTDTFSYNELFPDVDWDKISPATKQLHAKCLAAMTYLAIGRSYVKSNATIYAQTAFELSCSQLNECLEMDPNNQLVRKLYQKCEFARDKCPQTTVNLAFRQ